MDIAVPLLATKLHVPGRRRGVVGRARLTGRLDRVSECALTLVSAPAGFGKTTLVAEWLAGLGDDGPHAAWLSLDPGDSDPARFWAYAVAALRTATGDDLGAGALALLESSQPPTDAVVTALLNDLLAVAHEVVLVLDDYHVIASREVHEGLAYLLERLPAQVHVVITSRADPALPLARWRARGELVEIRAADLRFSPDESAAYLNGPMGLTLSEREVSALEGRTEGWIAALQLAALSMQGREDSAGFIAGFAGDDRYVVDYLTEEVVQRQPEPVQRFLLRTSVLDRLTGPLCDAVTGEEGGKEQLAALERGNLFLNALDDQRRWYRYHHLFADVLRAQLLHERPNEVAELHQRASTWFEEHGEPTEAIRHALAAGDVERAADLMELAMPAMRRSRQEVTIRSWLDLVPPEILRARPVLAVGLAGGLMASGEVESVDGLLRDAERWLDGPTGESEGMVVVDHDQLRLVPATIAMYRAGQALTRGDLAATVQHARRTLELLPEGDDLGWAGGTALMGLAWWAAGDIEAACGAYVDAMAGLQRAGHESDALGCALALADMQVARGRLGDALATLEQALRRVTGEGVPVLRGTADMHLGISEVLRERGESAAADEHLRRSRELGEHSGLPQHRYRWRVAVAQAMDRDGDRQGALALLDEAERAYTSDFSPPVRPVAAIRARLQVAHGDAGAALAWARERGLSADDDLSYLREYEHITLARALLAEHAGPALAGGDRAARPVAGSRRGRRQDGQRHRDPGAAGTRRPVAWRPRRRPRLARARADAGGAGGLRARLPRRGPADDLAAAGGGQPRRRRGLRPATARRA